MRETSPHAAPPGAVPYPPPAVGWYATIMLAFLYWMSSVPWLTGRTGAS